MSLHHSLSICSAGNPAMKINVAVFIFKTSILRQLSICIGFYFTPTVNAQ